jgi:hypothetical protein
MFQSTLSREPRGAGHDSERFSRKNLFAVFLESLKNICTGCVTKDLSQRPEMILLPCFCLRPTLNFNNGIDIFLQHESSAAASPLYLLTSSFAMASRVSLAAALVLALIPASLSFYLPGVAPTDYTKGTELKAKV